MRRRWSVRRWAVACEGLCVQELACLKRRKEGKGKEEEERKVRAGAGLGCGLREKQKEKKEEKGEETGLGPWEREKK